MGLNSDGEEISGSDEGVINNLRSHKKPYASRMVMSNKKTPIFGFSSVKKQGNMDQDDEEVDRSLNYNKLSAL
jgi:hypothetical protein